MIEMAPGAVVDGRYALLARLGTGGMAEVWSAEDSQLGRQVALKMLHPRLAADHDFVERFRREASAAAKLQHPNIVQVYDRGESQGTYYIAMEYLRGSSLKDLVRRGPLEPGHAVELIVQVLKGARFAHRRGIVHRDLKPHNVMLDDEGRVKVTDFGIARAGASDMTETGSIMGTAQYLSPEQAQGHAVTERSDLYSIGVMLFELLTGRVPFEGESTVTIALRHVSEPPPTPSSVNPTVPPALDAVVLRALAKDPEQRFRNADEFIAALAAATTAPDDTAAVARLAAAPPPPVTPYETLDEHEERSRGGLWWLAALLVLAAMGLAAFFLLQPDQVTVPDVEGREADAAVQVLEERGLEAEPREVESEEVEVGRVVAQTPAAGSSVSEGSVVTLQVSAGPGRAPVPDVSGQSPEQAQATLEDAGFEVRVSRRYSDDAPVDEVLRTNPGAGEQAVRGSEVALLVSRGPEPVAVPDVTDLDRDAAVAALEEAGFAVGVSEEETQDEEPDEVLEQDPAPGTELRAGAEVSIVVAIAPPDVEVPDVVDLRVEEAIDELEELDLEATRRQVDVPTPEEDGVVIDQDPPAGEKLEPGSEVVLSVGRFRPEETAPDETAEPTPTDPTDPTR